MVPSLKVAYYEDPGILMIVQSVQEEEDWAAGPEGTDRNYIMDPACHDSLIESFTNCQKIHNLVRTEGL